MPTDTIPITVEVKKRHINRGIPRSCGACPIARAILDLPNVKSANVGGKSFTVIFKDNKLILYASPREVINFIDKYDATRVGEPFTFVAHPIIPLTTAAPQCLG